MRQDASGMNWASLTRVLLPRAHTYVAAHCFPRAFCGSDMFAWYLF